MKKILAVFNIFFLLLPFIAFFSADSFCCYFHNLIVIAFFYPYIAGAAWGVYLLVFCLACYNRNKMALGLLTATGTTLAISSLLLLN